MKEKLERQQDLVDALTDLRSDITDLQNQVKELQDVTTYLRHDFQSDTKERLDKLEATTAHLEGNYVVWPPNNGAR